MFKGFVKSISAKIKLQPEKIGESLQNHRQSTIKLKDVLKTLKPEDLTNFIWLSILKPDSRFNAKTLSLIRKIDQVKSQKSLSILARNRLLIQSENKNEYYIHESLRIFASHLLTSQEQSNSDLKRLGIKWIDAHQKLILSIQNINEKPTKANDIYFLKNLDWHLQEAQWQEEIHSIISHIFPLNLWKNQVSQDIINNNLESINLISLAEKDCEINFQESPSEYLILLAKYKLMKNIHKHALQNIPAQWVKVLAETETWPEAKALDYIQSQSDSEQQAERIEHLSKIFSTESLDILVNIISDTKLDAARAKAISSIFGRLQPHSQKKALLLISEITSAPYRSMCLSSIASHTPIPLMHSAFTLIKSIQDQKSQALSLESFLPYFTVPLKKKSLELIKNIEDSNTKFRLLSQLKDTFPQVKADIIHLAIDVDTNYTKLAVLWDLQDRQKQTSDQIVTLLETCPSNLDKVLFLTDLIPDANADQLKEIWAIADSFEEDTLWGSAIIELFPFIDADAIDAVIDRTSKLQSDELKGELCIQIFPFAISPTQYQKLDGIIQSIENSDIKGIITSQILDYIPNRLSIVLKALKTITDPIKCLEIKIHLLEHDVAWGEEVIQSIQRLPDATLQTQFLNQAIYLLPNHLIPSTIDLVLNIKQPLNRDTLLNQLTPRLELSQIKQAIIHLSQETYPTELCQNISKQINRNYWESSVTNLEEKTAQALLAQIYPVTSNPPKKNTENILDEIFELSATANQSKILGLCITEIRWDNLQPETLLRIMTILSQGSSLELLRHLPALTQGIAAILGPQSLPDYSNICHQLSQPHLQQKSLDRQSKAHIYHKVESQENWPEIA